MLEEVEIAKEHLQSAGEAMLASYSPLLLGAAAIGLAILAVLLLVASCLCMRPCAGGGRDPYGDEHMDFDEDASENDDNSDDDLINDLMMTAADYERGGGRSGVVRNAPAESVEAQRVLVEVDGTVAGTVRCQTADCRSVRALRRRVRVACRELTGDADLVGDERLVLEYIDEGAGLAVLVVDEAELEPALRMKTLKATFSCRRGTEQRAGGRGAGARKQHPDDRAQRGRRNRAKPMGYGRALRSEEDADDAGKEDESEVGQDPPRKGSGCMVQ